MSVRSENENMSVGNAAALREALIGLAQAVQDFMATKGRNFYPDMAVALDSSSAALVAPARNCNLYDNVEDAWQAYKQFRAQTGEAIYFDMVHFWPFANWLFALAAERKGEGDGR